MLVEMKMAYSVLRMILWTRELNLFTGNCFHVFGYYFMLVHFSSLYLLNRFL